MFQVLLAIVKCCLMKNLYVERFQKYGIVIAFDEGKCFDLNAKTKWIHYALE